MHRQLGLSIAATNGYVPRAALMCFERAAVAGEEFSELLCVHGRYRLFHRSVEVNSNVESTPFLFLVEATRDTRGDER